MMCSTEINSRDNPQLKVRTSEQREGDVIAVEKKHNSKCRLCNNFSTHYHLSTNTSVSGAALTKTTLLVRIGFLKSIHNRQSKGDGKKVE
jgi:hypothetical protein